VEPNYRENKCLEQKSSGHNSGPVSISSGHNSGPVSISSGHNSGSVSISSGHNSGPVSISSCHNSGPVSISSCQNSGPVSISSGHNSGIILYYDLPFGRSCCCIIVITCCKAVTWWDRLNTVLAWLTILPARVWTSVLRPIMELFKPWKYTQQCLQQTHNTGYYA